MAKINDNIYNPCQITLLGILGKDRIIHEE